MSERERSKQAESVPEGRRRVEQELLGGVLDFDREIGRLEALGDETRFTILYLTAAEDGVKSGELADLLDRHQQDLYFHLNKLESAGLVGKQRADDGTRLYELTPLAEQFVPSLFESIRDRAEAV